MSNAVISRLLSIAASLCFILYNQLISSLIVVNVKRHIFITVARRISVNFLFKCSHVKAETHILNQ